MAQIKDALNAALKQAMKDKDVERRNTLRLFTSAIKQVEIDKQRELSDDDIIDILSKEAKTRRQTIDEMNEAGRGDLAENEQYELSLLEEFLPQQLTEDEIRALVQDAIASTGASSPKEMGKVMGALQPQIKGRADGKLVSSIVRESLS